MEMRAELVGPGSIEMRGGASGGMYGLMLK